MEIMGIKNKIAELKEKCEYGETPFHFACRKGLADIVEIIMKNSVKFEIDLNAKDNGGWTAFHLACMDAQSKVVEMLKENSAEFNINLNAKDNDGKNGKYFEGLYTLSNTFMI